MQHSNKPSHAIIVATNSQSQQDDEQKHDHTVTQGKTNVYKMSTKKSRNMLREELEKGAGKTNIFCFGSVYMSSKTKVKILDSPKDLAKFVSQRILRLIKRNNERNKFTVLCLPTGSTPIPIYEELIRVHQEEKFSFKNVVTFNLDEYFPISPDHDQSYNYFMKETFFKHVDINPKNIHIPLGSKKKEEYESWCEDYEKLIDKYGGLDLALLGIGRTGHIGFNEPGSMMDDPTRLVVLHNQTRKDNSRFFTEMDEVPKFAVTMGIGTIMKSKEIILCATSFFKAKIMHKTLEEEMTEEGMSHCPAAFLRMHPNTLFVMDKAAAYRLKQIKEPWLCENPVLFQWNSQNEKAAVLWLSKKVNKPILNLTESDLCDNHLSSLFYKYENDIEVLFSTVFNEVLKKIHRQTNYLLPNVDTDRVLIFSPHPDDDVLTIGGTMFQMIKKCSSPDNLRKNFKVCYMTSGSRSIGVDDLKDHLRFTMLSLPFLQIGEDKRKEIESLISELDKQKEGAEDSEVVQMLKTNVRKSEAYNAIEKLGLTEDNAVFLDLPFYRTGKDKKAPKSEEDVSLVLQLLREIQPHYLFVTSDLEDVHGTHGVCYHVLRDALQIYSKDEERKNDIKKIFLYKGMWQEFTLSQTSIFVSLTKDDCERKMMSILKHQSQMNKPLFPRDDKIDFFKAAVDRNLQTAADLTVLGLPNVGSCESLQVSVGGLLSEEIFQFG